MNKFRGEVSIQLDRERILKLDANALASFEGEYGKSVIALVYDVFTRVAAAGTNIARLGTSLGFREVRALLWAALLHEDEHLTIRQAGTLIDQAAGDRLMDKLVYVTSRVMEAFQLTMPEISKKNEAEILEALPELKKILEKANELPIGANSSVSPAASAS